MDRNSAAAASFIATFIVVEAIIVLLVVVFFIWCFWRIFTKAGYNGAMALLNLIPGVGHLICLIILAFGRWPVEDQLAVMQASSPTVVPPTMPPASPGTSVMPT